MSFISVFLGVVNYRNFDNYMASRLFKVVRSKPKDKDTPKSLKQLM